MLQQHDGNFLSGGQGKDCRLMPHLFSMIGKFFARRRGIKPTDSGLFDPFVPLGSLRRLENEYLADYPLTNNKDDFESQPEAKREFIPLRLVLFLVIAVFGWRLIALQIANGQENYRLAEGNRLRTKQVTAPRGLIYDRNGILLVENQPSFSLEIDVANLPPEESERQLLVRKLAKVLNVSPGVVNKRLENQTDQGVLSLALNLTRLEALRYQLKFNGEESVLITEASRRVYADTPGLGHLLGYIGLVSAEDLTSRPRLRFDDMVGKSGLEQTYDEYLQGSPGQEVMEVDSSGKVIRLIGTSVARPGNSVILGLDAKVQKVAAKALQTSIKKSGAKSGAAVAMDVNTGEVIAMVSSPSFDNNLFSDPSRVALRGKILSDQNAPLINRAIAGQYPSGSTIKPIIASAGLNEGVISSSTLLDTSAGVITIGEWTFPDWKTHGMADVRQAIAESNNIFFFALGGGYKQIGGLGVKRLTEYLYRFGFGENTGVDLTGEMPGLVPTPKWKASVRDEPWYIGDTYHLAIGQGDLLVTPLQLTRAIAAIANGGKLLRPRMISRILRSDGSSVMIGKTKIERDHLASNQVLQVVREGMRRAVESGSAQLLSSLRIQVAAKTGTAEFGKVKEKTHSLFTAFAPYSKPEIALVVIVEGGGEGHVVAAPVAKNIIESYFRLPITLIK